MSGVANVAMGIFGLASSQDQANAQRAQGEYQQRIFNRNADNAEREAADVLAIGDKEAAGYTDKVRTVVGRQQSGYAAQGVQVDGGVAADLAGETSAQGLQDAMTIKNNAWRASWGLKNEAENMRSQGRLARMGGNAAAGATLATGGLNFAGSMIKAAGTLSGGGGKGTKGVRGNSAGGSYADFSNYA